MEQQQQTSYPGERNKELEDNEGKFKKSEHRVDQMKKNIRRN